jgi:hypothetical protein
LARLAVTAYEPGDDWSDVASTEAPSAAQLRDHLQRRLDAIVEQVRRDAAGDGLPVVRTELVEGCTHGTNRVVSGMSSNLHFAS